MKRPINNRIESGAIPFSLDPHETFNPAAPEAPAP